MKKIGYAIYDLSVDVVGTTLGVAIFLGWLVWWRRGVVLATCAVGVATLVASGLSGCTAGKIAYDAYRDGYVR